MAKAPWDMTPSERLDHFETLERNWDSYGAAPIDPRAIAEARRLLATWPGDLPFVVPTTDGGVAFEFKDDTELHILPDGSIRWDDDEGENTSDA